MAHTQHGALGGEGTALALEGAANHHLLQLHALVQHKVALQRLALRDGQFHLNRRIAYVRYLDGIGARFQIAQGKEAIHVARHTHVQCLNKD